MPKTPQQPQYVNARGKTVELHISAHARKQFIARRRLLIPEAAPLSPHNVDATITRIFSGASRVKKLSKIEKQRLDRNGKDTLFFRTSGFTFIVQDATILTIEVSDHGKRHLNKIHHAPR